MSLLESLARRIVRHRRAVLVVALLVTALALAPASRLRPTADLVSLLPADAAAAADYRVFLETFGGLEKVFVLVTLEAEVDEADRTDEADDERSPSRRRRTLLQTAEALADRLAASPEVAAVRTGLDPDDEAFFLRHVVGRAPLLLNDAASDDALDARLDAKLDALTAPGALARWAEGLRLELTGPLAPTRRPLRRVDPLGFADDLDLPTGGDGLLLDALTGAFLSRDGAASLVVVVPTRSELDPEGGRALLAELERVFTELQAEADIDEGVVQRPRFQAVGGPLYAAQDESIIRADLESTIAGSVIGCTLVLLLAFRGVTVPGIALGSVAVALVWTAGALGLLLGEVTAVGLGFAAVLVGLGIDYGIHGGARFRAARLAGASPGDAVRDVFRHAGPGIATSASTTAVAFATLGAAHFRPLRELGIVVAVGIVMILVASATFGAAALAASARPRRADAGDASGSASGSATGAAARRGLVWRALERFVDAAVGWAGARPRLVLVAGAILSAVALWGAFRLELSADLRALRPADHPALAAEAALAERFDLGLDTSTVVVRGDDLGQVLERSAAVRSVLEEVLSAEAGGESWSISAPSDWLAAGPTVDRRLERLAADPRLDRIAAEIDAALVAANLSPRALAPGLEALRVLAEGRDPAPLDGTSWPRSIDELVRLGDTSRDPSFAALRLRLPKGLWPQGPPASVLERLEAVAPGVAVASVPRIAGELQRLARGDVEVLAEIALLLVALAVAVSFRAVTFRGRLLATILALVPVVCGTLWTVGLWGAFGGSLDLLSLSVVPILLGIGIDDGLHAVHAARVGAARDASTLARLGPAVRSAGLAMTLTTLTTAVGFGSLTLSSIPGLARGGAVVSLGVVACLAATLLLLPALGALRGVRDGEEPSLGAILFT